MAKTYTAIVKQISFLTVEVEADTLEEAEERIEEGSYDVMGPADGLDDTELVKFI